MRKLRYISLFSGIEAVSCALDHDLWEPIAFSEIDSFPSAVLAHHYPDVPNLGDITKVDWSPYVGSIDVVWGGSPCFPEGSLVTTIDGQKPIEQVAVGDIVLTHRNRWRKVTATGHKTSGTIIVKGQGSCGIECTPDHPFYSCAKAYHWDNDKRMNVWTLTDPEWVKAEDLKGRMWLNIGEAEQVPVVEPDNSLGVNPVSLSTELFYFVGRWIGDGWANAHHRKNRKASDMKRVYVCDSKDKADELRERLDATGMHFGMSDSGSTVRFTCSSSILHDWLISNFGIHADGKQIPGWCLGMPREWRQALFDGYMESDGCKTYNGWHTSTISRRLAVSFKMLAASLGYTTSIVFVRNRRPCAIIDGREVNERDQYSINVYDRARSAVTCHQGYWGLVRKILPGRSNVTVYNLSVEEDNSYVVDGTAVHNCQSFSIAGKREGLDGASGLMWEYVRAVQELRPKFFVWENVPGALSSSHGEDFRCLIKSMDELGYGLAWRVLDAQFFGVAQRRRRVFLVGSLGNPPQRAAEVLFEREGLPWDYSSSREKRKTIAEGTFGRVERADTGNGVEPGIYVCETANTNANGLGISRSDVMNTLDTNASTSVAVLKTPKTMLVRCGGDGGGKGALIQDDMSATLSTSNIQTLFAPITMMDTQSNAAIGYDQCNTLTAHAGKDAPIVTTGYNVRRLTPVECERLQGFPDGWTDVLFNGKPAPDSKRYKALGNSMAVPVMRWIGERVYSCFFE